MINSINYNENYKIKYNNLELNNNDKQHDLISNNERNKRIDDFYIEKERVKLILKNNLADGLFSVPKNIKYVNLLEESIYSCDSQYEINNIYARILKKNISQIQYVDSQLNDRSSSNADSLHDFFKEVKDSIITGKNDYLDVLKDTFSNYMKFVNELREILASISKYVSAASDDNHINFKRKDFYKKIKDFIDKYSSISNENLYFGEFVFEQDSDGRFYREIGGERIYANGIMVPIDAIEDLLKDVKSGKFSTNQLPGPPVKIEIYFKVDLSRFDKLLDLVLGGSSEDEMNKSPDNATVKLLSSEFNLLKNGMDAFEKNINSNLDELSKKYSAANSNYDNFVKIVSSTMNTLLEMAKGFLRF